MKFYVEHQEQYSRGELLLRTFFGVIYIAIPHFFLLLFVGIASNFITFLAFWAILFTGRYPQGMYEFQEKVIRWSLRVQARMANLCDGYPAFGLKGTDDHTEFQLQYPEQTSRGLTIVRALFGVIYVAIPHGFALIFRQIATQVLVFLAWWAVLFTGKYPESWHRFNVGTLRWGARVNLYLSHMADTYPPFSGKSDEELGIVTEDPNGTSSGSASSSDPAASSDAAAGSSDDAS